MAATFLALTPVSAFGANKIHLAFHNANVAGWEVRVLRVVILPSATAVTGAISSDWTLRRRTGTTTPPSGTGGVVPVPMDSALPLVSGVGLWNAPQVAPAGGTLQTVAIVIPQSDELKLSTLDAATMSSLGVMGGQVVYNAAAAGNDGVPLTLRTNETLELVQSATAGVGNCRIQVIFLIGSQ